MEYQNDSARTETIGLSEFIEVKNEDPDALTEVLEEGEEIVMKVEDGVISGEDIVDSKVDQTNMESAVTDSAALLKMECPHEDILEDTKINIKLEETTFKEMDVSDCTDFKEDVNAIKQEELIIKTEFDEPCGDTINHEGRNLQFNSCLTSSSKSEGDSSVKNCREDDLKTKQSPHPENYNELYTDVGVLSCGECAYRTRFKQNLKTHMLRHKSPSEIEMFSCGECDYQTMHKWYLKTHKLQHKSPAEIEMFRCGECDFSTKHKTILNSHKLLHTRGIEMFTCSECDFQTKHTNYLRKHKLVHKSATEIEWFNCGECAYKTKRKHDLKTHEIRHKSATEIEMLSCEKCAFQTKYQKALKTHMLRHKSPSEIKMFSCGECNYQSKFKGDLKAHMSKHKSAEEIEMFSCIECHFRTKYKHHLKRHQLQHRPKSEVQTFTQSKQLILYQHTS